MTYSSGNTILAADYNTFVGTVNTVIGPSGSLQSGTGYNQSTLSTVAASATIGASEWGTLLNAVRTAATHQGTSINLPTNPSAGNTIEALDGTTSSSTTYNLSAAVTAINSNKDNVAGGQQATIAGSTATTRASNWGSGGSETINATINCAFANQAAMDGYFNTGGEIHLTFQHPNGSTSQDNDWRDIFNNKIGTLKLGKTYTQRTGSSGTIATVAYTSLTTSYQAMFTGTNIGGGAYGANDVTVTMKHNGSNTVTFIITFVDQSTAIAPSTADVVQNGTAISVGFRRSSTYTPATPSVSVSDGL
jgi:hypothetical protein